MFKIDGNYSDYYDNTDITKYPGGKAINSSGVDTTDGTPWLAKMFNNTIGWMQALVIKVYGNLNGISGEPENVKRSDIVNALEKMRIDNNTAERTISDSKYLPFSGGTVTGDLSVTGETDLKKTTIDGDLQVNGNITESGEAYETHAEQIYTKSDLIVARDGAVAALSPNEYSGTLVRKADGTNDVAIAVDSDGNARVGNYELVIVYSEDGTHFFSDPELTNPVTIPAGVTPRTLAGVANRYYYAGTDDTEPLLTRNESNSMTNKGILVWNSTRKRAETAAAPAGAGKVPVSQADGSFSWDTYTPGEGGCPLGTIIPIYSNQVPTGYLPCNGTTFDETQYTSLYVFLGTNVLPDLRECALVGIGQNSTHEITTHDVYSLGEFKDDQLQEHEHYSRQTFWTTFEQNGNLYSRSTGGAYTGDRQVAGVRGARSGTTTHGKRFGINYVIKAVSGFTEEDSDVILANVQQYIQDAANLFPYPGHYVLGLTADSTRHISINSDRLINGAYLYRQTFADVATGSWTLENTGRYALSISRFGGRGSSAVDRIVTFSILAPGATETFVLDSDDPYLDSNTFSIEAMRAL